MKRTCKSIDGELKNLFIELLNGLHELGVSFLRNVEFYVDEKNENEIMEELLKTHNRKRFRMILSTIVRGKERPDLYGTEEISPKAKGVKAMKFTGGNRMNLRIYCKEHSIQGGLMIVMVFPHYKKTKKVSGKLKSRIETIGGYEYEF